MKKLLFITNMSKGIGSFSIASLYAAQSLGLEFHMAGNFDSADEEKLENDNKKYGVYFHNLDLSRNPYSRKNYKAYKELVDLIKKEKIDLIHCNTPTGGLLGRLAGSKCNVKKIIYEAHGFHFYKSAPLKNWLLYYTVEKILSKKTDIIVTINREDYELAIKKLKPRKKGKVCYVPGVGIETSLYMKTDFDQEKKRKELGFTSDNIIVISMGDLIERKNYSTAIRAIKELNDENVHYIICGTGPLEKKLKLLANSLNIENQIHFLGFRKDINELLHMSNIFLFTSYQEGLPRSTMEAMACGLPCVVSKIRGNVDLIDENKGGFLCAPNDTKSFFESIEKLINNDLLRKEIGVYNSEKINSFSLDRVSKDIEEIYRLCFSLEAE